MYCQWIGEHLNCHFTTKVDKKKLKIHVQKHREFNQLYGNLTHMTPFFIIVYYQSLIYIHVSIFQRKGLTGPLTRPPEDFEVIDVPNKGKGVFTKKFIPKGEAVLEYCGVIRAGLDEPDEDEDDTYIFECVFKGKKYWFDATVDNGCLGRLINHDAKYYNVKPKVISVDEKPHIYFFSVKEINPKEEILYNYGKGPYPWRNTVKTHSSLNDAPIAISTSDRQLIPVVMLHLPPKMMHSLRDLMSVVMPHLPLRMMHSLRDLMSVVMPHLPPRMMHSLRHLIPAVIPHLPPRMMHPLRHLMSVVMPRSPPRMMHPLRHLMSVVMPHLPPRMMYSIRHLMSVIMPHLALSMMHPLRQLISVVLPHLPPRM
ncbi:uncharacterized protein, partial [Argopecten irradians]|uniref:uncharacterized protein n=1 Tax=Argopecten irradians TaxID=31199 RepID=UPI0037166973